MSKILVVVRQLTKKMMFKKYDISVKTQPIQTNKVIRRCITDVPNRTYCASSFSVQGSCQKKCN